MERVNNFYEIYEKTPNWVFAGENVEGMRLLQTNSRILEFTGYTKEEFETELNNEVARIIPEEYHKKIWEKVDELLQGEEGDKVFYETAIRKKDGSLRHLKVDLYLSKDETGKEYFYTYCMDITKLVESMERANKQAEFMRILYENLPDSVLQFLVQEEDHLVCTYANKAALKISEVELEDLIGRDLVDCFPGKFHQDTISKTLKELKESEGILTFENKVCREDGSVTWVKGNLALVVDPAGEMVVQAVYTDVTENKIAELQYREELDYQYNLSASIVANCRLNVTKKVLEGICLRGEDVINDEFRKMLNYKDRISGILYNISLTQEEAKELEPGALIEKYNEGERELTKEFFGFDKETGQMMFIHLQVRMVRRPETDDIIAFFNSQDVTNDKELSSLINGIVETDYDRISYITVANGFYKRLVGRYSRKTPMPHTRYYNKGIRDFLHHYASTGDMEGLIESFNLSTIIEHLEKEPTYTILVDILEEDGKLHSKQYRFIYAGEDHSQIIMTRVDVQNIVEREQKKQEELERAIDLAERANNAKSEFLSNMSHDIRTPMNAILGVAEIAKEDNKDPVIDDYLDKIKDSGKFLLGLINDILDISKIESGRFVLSRRKMMLKEFEEGINTIILPLMEKKNIHFVQEMKCGATCIMTDPVRFDQLFFNLLSNAAKYTPENGNVFFGAEFLRKDANKEWVRFTVKDDGMGMTKEFQEHAFDAFSQEKSEVIQQWQGTGLGLAIVKKLVDVMEGTIELKSEYGKGSEFRVILPLETVREDINVGEQIPIDYDMLEGKKILLAEDNNINTLVATRILESKGIVVEHAENGLEAVALFDHSKEEYYDAILMDIRMPEMNGLEATKKIRQLEREDAKRVPILAMTANAFDEDVEKSIEAGMNAHLSKPINPQKLYRALNEVMM